MSSLPTPVCSPLSAHTHESTMDSLLELPAPLQRQRTRSEGTIGIPGYGHSSYSYSPEIYPDTSAPSHYKSSVRLQVPTHSSTWHHPSSYKGVEYHSPLYDRMLTPVSAMSATPFESTVLTGRSHHGDMSAITSPYTSSYSAAPSAEPETYSFVESTSYGNGHYNTSMDPVMMQSGMASSHIASSHRNDGLDYFQENDHSHSSYNGVIGL